MLLKMPLMPSNHMQWWICSLLPSLPLRFSLSKNKGAHALITNAFPLPPHARSVSMCPLCGVKKIERPMLCNAAKPHCPSHTHTEVPRTHAACRLPCLTCAQIKEIEKEKKKTELRK
ncbi:hypothetical protein LX36DRAFT_235844 [Colletotrichum falcatum]|nr:hypothetical protein LX36DRAFT_235844 [Colletotrichum falcatum]